jgi:RHS repeat-associated protein
MLRLASRLMVLGISCTVVACGAKPRDSVEVKRGALESPVVVSVIDTLGAPKTDLQVMSQTPEGASGGYVWNDENGQATVNVEDPGAYDFYVQLGATRFYSGHDGECVLPGCTAATITVTQPTLVTVVDGSGAPVTAGDVVTFDENGAEVVYEGVDEVTGVATVYVPAPGPHRFGMFVDGDWYYSGEPGSCVYPICQSATITVSSSGSPASTSVAVSVVDTDGAPVSGVQVMSQTPGGASGGYVWNDDNGHATVPVENPGSYDFYVQLGTTRFYSGHDGQCEVPACTSATITVTKPTLVTVEGPSGTPFTSGDVVTFDENGVEVVYEGVDLVTGIATVRVPAPGAHRFGINVDGIWFYSGAPGSCVYPACQAATIVVYPPVDVIVTDTDGTPKTNLDVSSITAAGTFSTRTTDANGVASFRLSADDYRFSVQPDHYKFYSGAEGHCSVPGCDSATIAISKMVRVTVKNAAGAPVADKEFVAIPTEGEVEASYVTNEYGFCDVTLPELAWRFKAACAGMTYYSGAPGHCALPGCEAALITLGCGGSCAGQPDGTSCSDLDACTTSDHCDDEVCIGMAVSCTASDQCHTAGTCDPATGVCSNPAKADGTTCDDGNPATSSDQCTFGACAGSTSNPCPAPAACRLAGMRDPATSVCTYPFAENGSFCDDGNSATQGDRCQSGVCLGSTGTCPYDYAECDDGNPCTQYDYCYNGACRPGSPRVCGGIAGECASYCDPSTGQCTTTAAPNGTSCNDGNRCTNADVCNAGACVGAGACTGQVSIGARDLGTEITASLPVVLTADRTTAMPSQPINLTAQVTNEGVELRVFGYFDITNDSSSEYVVPGYALTVEYQSAVSHDWIPLASISYDATGALRPHGAPSEIEWSQWEQPDGSAVTYVYGGFAGTRVGSGAAASWWFYSRSTLDADALAIVTDPAQSLGLRHVVRLDPATGLPAGGDASGAIDSPATGTNFGLTNVNVSASFEGSSVTLTPAGATSLNVGQSITKTGVIGSVVSLPPSTHSSYLALLNSYAGRTFSAQAFASGISAASGYTESISEPARIAAKVAVVKPTIVSGPGTVPAGYPVTFNTTLENTGSAAATNVAVQYRKYSYPNFTTPTANITAPTTLGVGQTQPATIVYDTPAAQATGVDSAIAVTWSDAAGNLYGPLQTNIWYHNLSAPLPLGSIALAGQASGPVPVDAAQPLTATARSPLGALVPGVVVQLSITGANPQTLSATTDAWGVAHFSYPGKYPGGDTVVASGTITTGPVQSNAVTVFWSAPYATPCTSPDAPLDVVIAIDTSSSMEGPNLAGAKAAARSFLDTMDLSRDQLGIVSFGGFARLDGGLTSSYAQASAGIDNVSPAGGFINPTSIGAGLWAALDELASARRRPTATPIIVFVSDGGNSFGDPEPALARLATSGIRTFAFALGADADFAMLKRIATTKNELFYVPSAGELAWLYRALRADLCRNQLPLVRAGGDQGAYGVRLPHSLPLHGEVHDDGPASMTTGEWTVVSGPGIVTFLDASSPETTAFFSDPGTYVLRLTGSDGLFTATDDATITVDPEPSLVGGHLQEALGLAGPLSTGTSETFTATLTDAADQPISDYPVQMTITGANPKTAVLITDEDGVVTFSYVGATIGTDSLTATAIAPTPLVSSTATVEWVLPAGAQPVLTQGWLGAPVHQSKVDGQVAITAAAGQTLTAGTITYWPMSAPEQVRTLATGVTGGPGSTLATLDTTVLANGPWVVKLEGTNSSGQSRISMVSVTVTGEYKPGRVVVEMTDMTIPVVGMPVTVGRRYDSLEKDNVGDFGHGWSLAIGHPRLEVDPAHNVTLTMPDNKRVTFYFQATSVTASIVFAWLYGPGYVPEAGTYGTLTADGCPLMLLNGGKLVCFLENSLEYAPTTYTYTDPYGRAFTMGATGELQSIKDRQGNTLTFAPEGITSNTGVTVPFERDTAGRITKITSPPLDAGNGKVITTYEYDSAGDLVKVNQPQLGVGPSPVSHTYSTDHRLLTSKDGRGNTARTSTYDTAGHLLTDTDALGNVTSYAYDFGARKTTITNPDTGTVQQTFDPKGLLLEEIDPLGRKTVHTYDANKNELTRKNALDEVTTFTYDANGNQTSIENARGETTVITYNAFSQPLTSTDPTGHTTTIEYDERGIPKKFSDEIGTLATFTSSERGLPLTMTDAAGKTAYMTYDAAGNLTSRVDRLGRRTAYVYDGMGRLTSETDPRGGLTRHFYRDRGVLNQTWDALGNVIPLYEWDNNANPTLERTRDGHVKYMTYNALNQLTKIRHEDSSTIEYTRDFRGNALTMKDEAGRTTTYEYDKAGQLKKTTFPDTTFTTRAYDVLGRLVTATDERGNATTYEYQTGCGCADRQTKVTDPLNRSTTTTYDAAGRRSSVTDAANHTTSYAYDERGHLTTTTYADNTTEADAYDTRGRRTSHTDQMSSATQYGYDDEGQLTSVTDALSHVTSYGYDASGNLASVTDANNHTTTYAYDALSRKTKRTLPLGMFETFAYNIYGDQTSHKDFRGKTTTTTYDTRSRLLTKVPDPTLGEPTVTFTYNPTGTRLKMVDASGTTNYTYDTRDRLLTRATPAGTLTYTYDPAGNVATIRSSNTSGTSVDYAWDAANQIVSVTDNRAGGVTASAYTATGRPSTLTQPSGVGATYSYDTRDRVTSLAWKQGTNPAFGSWTYGFNPRGQRTSVTSASGRHVAYGYDAVSRFASETITNDPQGAIGNGALSYSLDSTGNRLSRTSTLAALGAQSFSYDANDQLASHGYDANGNTTAADGHTYTYDFENRLKSKDGTVTIVYDGDGSRAAKTVGGVTTKYLAEDLNPTGYLQVLEEVSGGAVQVAYTYGTMVASQRRVGAGGAMSYYGYDAHGNVTFLTDATGAVTDTYDYDAWGNVVVSTGTTPNTRVFTGEELDPDLGLINLRARQYKASSGRFVSGDPLLEKDLRGPAAFNAYVYANSDPSNLRDPLGLLAGGQYSTVLGIGALAILGSQIVAIGTSGKPTMVEADRVTVVGHKSTCAFWKAWSAYEMIEAVSQCRLPTPPPAPYQSCKSDCEDEWAAAMQRCCDLINNPGRTPRERRERKRLRGGHMTVYECAKGYVSERCGGNDIDWGPHGPLH